MFRTREGVQAMLSKYYAARRRMESLAKQAEELQKKLEKLPKNEKVSQEVQQELERLRQAMVHEAGEIRKLAAHTLPYDLDKYLTPELHTLAKLTDDMAKELEKLQDEKDLQNGKLAGDLNMLAKRFGGRSQAVRRSGGQTVGILRGDFSAPS